MLTRRGLLRGVAAATAVTAGLGGGVVAVSLLPPAHRTPRHPLKALSPRAFSILAAVADRICPGGEGLPTAWELEVPEGLDALMDSLHPGVAPEFTQALFFLENPVAGTVLDGRMARFTQSSPEVQDDALRAFASSSLGPRRQAYKALTGLVSATYWSHPRTWAHTGYPGPPRFPQSDPGIPWDDLPTRLPPPEVQGLADPETAEASDSGAPEEDG